LPEQAHTFRSTRTFANSLRCILWVNAPSTAIAASRWCCTSAIRPHGDQRYPISRGTHEVSRAHWGAATDHQEMPSAPSRYRVYARGESAAPCGHAQGLHGVIVHYAASWGDTRGLGVQYRCWGSLASPHQSGDTRNLFRVCILGRVAHSSSDTSP
jgi:hypothetical protein